MCCHDLLWLCCASLPFPCPFVLTVRHVCPVFSDQTGERIGVLNGHTDRVIGTLANPSNSLQALSASRDGTVRLWDFYEQSCLRVYKVGAPIKHMAFAFQPSAFHSANQLVEDPSSAAAKARKYPVLYLNVAHPVDRGEGAKKDEGDKLEKDGTDASNSKSSSKDVPSHRACRILMLDLQTKQTTTVYKSVTCVGLAVSVQRRFVASISNKTLSVWSTKDNALVKHSHVRDLTTVAIHPQNKYIATGDVEGQIVLWHDFTSKEDVKCTHLHWHAHSVSALNFSNDGIYLLSGGEEAVLVLWQLDTGSKQFLPRLGILFFSFFFVFFFFLFLLFSFSSFFLLVSLVLCSLFFSCLLLPSLLSPFFLARVTCQAGQCSIFLVIQRPLHTFGPNMSP